MVTEEGAVLPKSSYGYLKNKRVTLTAPAVPGTYGVGFLPAGKVTSFVKITVTPVSATLTVPQAVEISETFTVQWTGPAYKKDRIYIEKPDDKKRVSGYAYPSNSKDGAVSLRAPVEAGGYEVIYQMGGEVLAREVLNVGGTVATVKFAPKVQAGGDVDVMWTGPDNRQDTIRIITVEAKPQNVGSSAYTSNSTGNAVMLVAPEKVGSYEIAYFLGSKIIARQPLEVVPVSATLDAPEEVVGTLALEVKWTGPGNRQDRVVMISAKETGENPAVSAQAYVDSNEPVVTLTAPAEPGDYLLHYWTGKGATLATRPMRVTPPPTEPGLLRVASNPKKGFGENSAVEVILDASGSMLKRQGGKRRIEIAKETLLGLIGDTIPAKTGFALRVFGHKETDSCRTDLEIPLGPLDPAAAKATVSKINAMNLAKTPIAASLEQVASDLSGITGERIIIMVTDGEETCDGDPALAIRALRSIGSDVRVNIVGYSIDDANLKETFSSWATLGGGQYLNAPDADELAKAMKRALEIPFEVFDGETLIATGISGGQQLELPAGLYQVRYKWDGRELAKDVQVRSETRVEISLP